MFNFENKAKKKKNYPAPLPPPQKKRNSISLDNIVRLFSLSVVISNFIFSTYVRYLKSADSIPIPYNCISVT